MSRLKDTQFRVTLILVSIGVGAAILYGLNFDGTVAESSGPAPTVSPFREGYTPDWALNGEPMPPSETVPPPQPGDIVIDEITPIDEALAAEAREQALHPPTIEDSEREWAPQLAADLGVTPDAALAGLILLRTIDTAELYESVKGWLGDSYAGGWIDWEPDRPFFNYAYSGELPTQQPPQLLADLLATGEAGLVDVSGA